MSSPIYASAADRGRNFARYALALAKNPNDLPSAVGYSRAQFGELSAITTVLKAAVGAGTTTDGSWAGAVSEYATLTSEFLALLQPRSILGQLQPALRQVPLGTRVWRQIDSAMTAYWAGQGAAKPLAWDAFDALE